jgi:hypothetical protein
VLRQFVRLTSVALPTTSGWRLQPVAGGEAPVGLAGALICGRGAVAVQHGPGAPAGQAHQIGLAAALGEPLVGERVASW